MNDANINDDLSTFGSFNIFFTHTDSLRKKNKPKPDVHYK